MKRTRDSVKAAVVQASPILFDRAGTIEKAGRLIAEAGAKGAGIVLFPEAYIPAYPRGMRFGVVVGSRDQTGRGLWGIYQDQSIDVPGPDTELLGEAARKAGVYLVMGVIERDARNGGTLYCTSLYFGPDGTLLGKHRKLKPTAAERYIWGEGDGSTLNVYDTEYGKLGGLICWENYMPLARATMYNKGVALYMAPTADARDSWQATLRHIACEGRCFVLGCNQYITKSMYPEKFRAELADQPEELCRGGSAIISPLGDVLAGPLFGEEGILYADLDLNALEAARFDFDPIGHYARPDVFQLIVDERPKTGFQSRPIEEASDN